MGLVLLQRLNFIFLIASLHSKWRFFSILASALYSFPNLCACLRVTNVMLRYASSLSSFEDSEDDALVTKCSLHFLQHSEDIHVAAWLK